MKSLDNEVHINCAKHWILSKIKMMKRERESAGDFLVCLCSLSHKYFMTKMITKRSNVYIPYSYTRIKYKNVNA